MAERTGCSRRAAKYQLDFTYADTSQLGDIERSIRPTTRLLFLETPTNPVLRLTDLAGACTIAHGHGIPVVVDNTFASPYVQRPIDFGADLVIHSTTKFLNGHSDSVGGAVIAVRDDHIEWLRFIQNAEGAILGPMDAWLVLRGTKTLPIRMERHNANALGIAEYLASHPKVNRVHYPGLPSHPQHDLARRQMEGFGGLLSFEMGSLRARRTVITRGIDCAGEARRSETLISNPEPRRSLGPTRAAQRSHHRRHVRISVGSEDVET